MRKYTISIDIDDTNKRFTDESIQLTCDVIQTLLEDEFDEFSYTYEYIELENGDVDDEIEIPPVDYKISWKRIEEN
jgi:hypothetical protein